MSWEITTFLEYLIKSVYRYMAKMEKTSARWKKRCWSFEEFIEFQYKNYKKPEFEKAVASTQKYQGNRLESRAFAYLDVISWLESKIYGLNVQDVIRQKYLKDKGKRVSDVVNTLTPVCFAVSIDNRLLAKSFSSLVTSFNWFIDSKSDNGACYSVVCAVHIRLPLGIALGWLNIVSFSRTDFTSSMLNPR